MEKDSIEIKKDDFINLKTTIRSIKTNSEASKIAFDGMFEVADDINKSFKKKVGVDLHACKELNYHIVLILNTYRELFKDIDKINNINDRIYKKGGE